MASLDELLHEVRRIEEHRVELTEKKIKSIYRSLTKDLNNFISEEYLKYADEDGRLFLSYLDSKNKRAKFLEEIVKNVDGISPEVKKQMLDLVDKTYEKAYKGMADAVKNADDTKELLSSTKTLVKPEVLKQAVNNNIDKLTLDAVMQKHRAEIVADIQQTLTLGLMRGDRYETMAKRIQERLGVSNSKAKNIARTESHRNIESGLLDGAKETASIIDEDDNLIYAATWKTMKDERVRPQVRRKTKSGWKTTMRGSANHMKMDGVTIKVGEEFQLETGVTAECPGKSGTARNDCNCRCYLSYKLMTVEEFAKATGQTEEAVRKKYKMARENEDSPRKNSDGDYAVDWSKVQTEEYSDKFKQLSDNERVSAAIETRAKWALNNRNATNTEELYAINLKTGDEISRIADQRYSFGVKRTDAFKEALQAVDDMGDEILLIHNHPRGMPPSVGDINSLMQNINISGITAGHDGSVYYYTRPTRMIPPDEFEVALRHFKGFTEKTAMEKALESLQDKYGFTFKKL